MNFKIMGLNHLGLVVEDIAIAKKWFVDTLKLELILDRGELLFLLAGKDVIAIKTAKMAINKPEHGGEDIEGLQKGKSGFQSLDHYGFYAQTPSEVDAFAQHVAENGATILKGPYDRIDGRSVYIKDPCNNVCEFLYFKQPNNNLDK